MLASRLPRALPLLLLLLPLSLFVSFPLCTFAFPFSSTGWATLTHYDLPYDYIASCGCVGASTKYPTAALNSQAYGSNTSFGPSCGLCFELRLVSTPLSPPAALDDPDAPWGDGIIYSLSDVEAGRTPNLVVKIIDLCPGVGGPWCNSTTHDNGTMEGNSLGSMVHFDLAWPSRAISKDFFLGDHDYGVWNTTYEAVSCDRWKGDGDRAAVGSDWDQQNAACCPADPMPSGADATCPAYYDAVETEQALVPNTSNVLSKGKGSSSAASAAVPRRAAAQQTVASLGWMAALAMPAVVVASVAAAASGLDGLLALLL